MNRLQAELQRLYAIEPHAGGAGGSGANRVGGESETRVLVLELALPPSWDDLNAVWQGVQADLALPAPAIAVSGADSYQLWFSTDEPLPRAEGLSFLQALRSRYLGALSTDRIRMHAGPLAAGLASQEAPAGCAVPPTERMPGRWSAFLAPDLAALFVEEPWLDLPPSPDAQADLLSRLQPAPVADLRQALGRLAPAAPPVVPRPLRTISSGAAAGSEPPHPSADPGSFLAGIMNDPSVDLSLRIEAAKALLPYHPPGHDSLRSPDQQPPCLPQTTQPS